MHLPQHCRPQAWDFFAQQMPRIDSCNRALLNAAVAISMHELRDADPCAVDRRLEELAADVRERIPHHVARLLGGECVDIEPILAHLHEVLFDEYGLRGNTADFYNPFNSYIPTVLQTQRGIPITLTLIYSNVAQRVGLRVQGVNSPGHFLAAVLEPQSHERVLMYVDSFEGGRALRREEAMGRLRQITGQTPPPPPARALAPATNRQWLSRMLNNLQNTFAHDRRENDFAAMQELQELLL